MKIGFAVRDNKYHVNTLTIFTPKGRRRIRKILGVNTRMLNRSDMVRAKMRACDKETAEARAFLKMSEEHQRMYRDKSRYRG